MRVLNDSVLILEVKGKEKTDGGIILPGQAVERPLQGTVIAVGPGEKMEDGGRYPLDVAVGDLVFYPAKTGDVVSIDGTEYRVVPEKYILGVLIEADVEDLGLDSDSNTAIKKTPENIARLASYADGDYVPVDAAGNIACFKTLKSEEDYEQFSKNN